MLSGDGECGVADADEGRSGVGLGMVMDMWCVLGVMMACAKRWVMEVGGWVGGCLVPGDSDSVFFNDERWR